MNLRYLFFLTFVHGTLGVNAVSLNDSISYGIISLNNQALIERPIELSCFWEFYPDQLLTSQQMDRSEKLHFIEMPHWWQEEKGKPTIEYATYRLKVITQHAEKTNWAIAMPTAYCSYELWINGAPLGNNGLVGKTQELSHPQWKPDTYSFMCASDTIEITIRTSSFYHHRKGISDPIVLGTAQQLFKIKDDIEITDTVLLVTFAVLFLVGFFYFYKSGEKPYLFYSLLCVSWMLRAAFSNHYQAVQWFPQINWFFVVRAEYIGIYLSTLFGSLLLSSLFPKDTNKLFINSIIIICFCFTVFTLLVQPRVFTAYVQFYLGLSSILLLFILIIVFKAYVKSRQGTLFILFTTLFGVLVFSYVILAFQGVFQLNELFFNAIFIIEFVLILIAVSYRIKMIGTDKDYSNKMTFQDSMTSQ